MRKLRETICSAIAIFATTSLADSFPTTAQSILNGPNVSLNGARLFPPGDLWNQDISKRPIDPRSNAIINSIGAARPLHPDFGTTYNGVPWGIPYLVVGNSRPTLRPLFMYAAESDPGPYPIPLDAPIEGGPNAKGDRHVLVLDKDAWKIYELWKADYTPDGRSWYAGSGAVFDLRQGSDQRPVGWTSADAAGLSVLAGLVRYDEAVEAKEITHALRFTVRHSRRAYVPPARHFASRDSDVNLPPMGMRVRLKASFDISHFPPTARVILKCLQTYGMILADNGGDWFLSGAPNPAWNDTQIETLKHVKGSDFEVLEMDAPVTK